MTSDEIISWFKANPKLACEVFIAFPPIIMPWVRVNKNLWSRGYTGADQASTVAGVDGKTWWVASAKKTTGHQTAPSSDEAFQLASSKFKEWTGSPGYGPDVPEQQEWKGNPWRDVKFPENYDSMTDMEQWTFLRAAGLLSLEKK